MNRRVVVLDYGSGNVRSAVRMLERVGADVTLTAQPDAVARADGLYVPGVGNFHACMNGLRAVDGPRLIRDRIGVGAPVLGVCVGMQVLFEGSAEETEGAPQPGLGVWSGEIHRLRAQVVPHMGWSQVEPAPGSDLFDGLDQERFYFVHSFAADEAPTRSGGRPMATWSRHGDTFLAAVEDGALAATQFHPEKSGDAGAELLTRWLRQL
ncbi:imidazole glycerol phosphate synthase subunit HisH [Demetria terragena]|uniref:imidazole glycerol phosphate synthase subunit HisH n=1 Tax=Demetria terragena TaxID=63959 RepID=UPI00037EF010|nr:imidazole glycerol phosphate synthase subunit HisH [Demetria terragena]